MAFALPGELNDTGFSMFPSENFTGLSDQDTMVLETSGQSEIFAPIMRSEDNDEGPADIPSVRDGGLQNNPHFSEFIENGALDTETSIVDMGYLQSVESDNEDATELIQNNVSMSPIVDQNIVPTQQLVFEGDGLSEVRFEELQETYLLNDDLVLNKICFVAVKDNMLYIHPGRLYVDLHEAEYNNVQDAILKTLFSKIENAVSMIPEESHKNDESSSGNSEHISCILGLIALYFQASSVMTRCSTYFARGRLDDINNNDLFKLINTVYDRLLKLPVCENYVLCLCSLINFFKASAILNKWACINNNGEFRIDGGAKEIFVDFIKKLTDLIVYLRNKDASLLFDEEGRPRSAVFMCIHTIIGFLAENVSSFPQCIRFFSNFTHIPLWKEIQGLLSTALPATKSSLITYIFMLQEKEKKSFLTYIKHLVELFLAFSQVILKENSEIKTVFDENHLTDEWKNFLLNTKSVELRCEEIEIRRIINGSLDVFKKLCWLVESMGRNPVLFLNDLVLKKIFYLCLFTCILTLTNYKFMVRSFDTILSVSYLLKGSMRYIEKVSEDDRMNVQLFAALYHCLLGLIPFDRRWEAENRDAIDFLRSFILEFAEITSNYEMYSLYHIIVDDGFHPLLKHLKDALNSGEIDVGLRYENIRMVIQSFDL
ncbi:hypothetical protein PCE1_001250 [Barthelona sp. PCE]